MIKYYCDRCKQETANYDRRFHIEITATDKSSSPIDIYNLYVCYECMRSIKLFLDKMKNE